MNYRLIKSPSYLHYGVMALLLLLVGCSSSVSQMPAISKQELKAEQSRQKTIIQQESQRKQQLANQPKPTTDMQLARLRQVGLPVQQAGINVCRQMALSQQCQFPIALDKAGAPINAYTDGKQIVISPKMMEFAHSNVQLATVLAHEYPHAIMNHPQKTQKNAMLGGILGMALDALAESQGFSTGQAFSQIGQSGAVLRYSQDFEREADYIGLYILQRAGYNSAKAAQFWRRMATLNPDSIFASSTHPTTAERYLLLAKTAEEIAVKQRQNRPLLPEKLPEDS
jgi:predicted Zn-dependent protease